MGTVGLSFGSPTSGAGFNVSQTVSEIVGNLQNVETPWKNQLSTLESQDTVLSNLGTLFSNLSNDMSSLTDFNGILAQKTGSSSNTSVLELTSASSSATAGTHTVTVNSLAQTSSGYLAEVSDSSSTLAGSITLQVGSGTAETFTIGTEPTSPASNTTYTGTGNNTLAALASAINASNVGITANVESDSNGAWLSLTSNTSGAAGNLAVSQNSIAGTGQILAYTGTAGTGTAGTQGATASSGTFKGIGSSDSLSGSISIQVGNASAVPISMTQVSKATGGTTVADLAQYLAANDSSLVTATTTNNSDGTVSLSLTSATAGSAGTLNLNSTLADTASTALGYSSAVTGVDANLTIDGKANISSASNTVSNLIPGLTFQLLSTSSTAVQIVIGNDNSDVESTVNQFVSDYNSLISAVNTQEGNTSLGTAEPLFGSPTLSLLQQQLLSSIDNQSPNGYLDAVDENAGVTFSGSLTIQTADGASEKIVVGAGTTGDGTIYTGAGNNTLNDIVSAINSAAVETPVSFVPSTDGTSGTVTANSSAELTGTFSLTTDNGATQTIYLGPSSDAPAGDLATGDSDSTLSSLETFLSSNAGKLGIEASLDSTSSVLTLTSSDGGPLSVDSGLWIPGFGATAGVATNDGQSSLTLLSQTEGADLTVDSSLTASTPTALSYTDSATSTSSTPDSGTLGTAGEDGTLTGSLAIQVGGGASVSITADEVAAAEGGTTLDDFRQYIQTNTTALGVNAAVVQNGDGTTSLSITSNTDGSDGILNVKSNLYDTSNQNITAVNYNGSSDVNSLTGLGISVNNDGSITFDASTLDSLLNTDYSGVVSFFQDANSWGSVFSNMLENAGSSSSTGVLKLAQNANSSVESNLNANISKEESLISAQQTSLTAELNSANEILEQLPSQLDSVNELYSAITGYEENQNG
jgi:flagellar hook-associated protein 2